MKTYEELVALSRFLDRFEYLKLDGSVGEETFGFDRYLNQKFYKSDKWRKVRNDVIIRDNGCDLGIKDRPIFGTVYIHHINPISRIEIINSSDILFDMNNLICVSFKTHNAIHYGSSDILETDPIVRTKGDTKLW